MDTKRTITEIEVALAQFSKFEFTRNVVAFNVNGWGETLPIHHECDMLVMSPSGYLTEIEIKRSWTDFLADFEKKHHHSNEYGTIKYFYYAVPEKLLERVQQKLFNCNIEYTGVITYDEDLWITLHGREGRDWFPSLFGFRRLYMEQRLEVARLAAMRVILLKADIIKLKNELSTK